MHLLSVRLIVSLIVGITLVSLGFSYFQVVGEKRNLRRELERRGEVLGESLAGNVEKSWNVDSERELQKLVQRFGNREHLLGVAIYDRQGKLLAVTPELGKILAEAPPVLSQAMAGNQNQSVFQRLSGRSVYFLAVPLQRQDQVAGALVVVQDVSYIREQSLRVWRVGFLRVLTQVVIIVLVTLLIVRWSMAGPIAQAAQWIRALRTGKASSRQMPNLDMFRPLAREVATIAESLSQARIAAENEARLREAADSTWTADRLSVQVRTRLEGSGLFVVSNRQPYMHQRNGKSVDVIVPASGLVTALEPVLNACDGTWIAHGNGDADMEAVDEKDRLRVPPDDPRYTLRRVWLSKQEEDGYYYGFANEGLWPLCHNAHTRPNFRASDWEHYYNVNQKFADALVEEIGSEQHPVVLIQDYHFALLPRMVKERLPHARVAIFWHIPWPNPESFEICPWQRELLGGLLGADLIGFHVRAHCNNFLNTVDHALEARIDWEHFSVKRNEHTSLVLPFPISVECCDDSGPRSGTDVADERRAVLKEAGAEATYIGVGVDRIDYTKGIVERFQAVESFLERYPSYQGKFTLFQLGAPTRTHIKRYADFQAEVEAEANRINARFKRGRWSPIVLQVRQHSRQEVQRYYRIAHLCMVTSLHDGMNLVAKEFVAAKQDERGVLILSRFTGAARELRDAIIVNPYDIEATGEAIAQALRMDVTEMTERMRHMRNTVREHNIYWWAGSLIGTLCEVRLDQAEPVVVPANDKVTVET